MSSIRTWSKRRTSSRNSRAILVPIRSRRLSASYTKTALSTSQSTVSIAGKGTQQFRRITKMAESVKKTGGGMQELKAIPLNQIHARENYRKTFRDASLKELAQSIKENGVLEPIIVRPNQNGYEIIAGERRFRAASLAKLVTIPAVVREVADGDIS